MNEKPTISVPSVPTKSPKWPIFVAIAVVGLFLLMFVGQFIFARIMSVSELGGLDESGYNAWAPDADSFGDVGISDLAKIDSQNLGGSEETISSEPTTGVAPTDKEDRMIIKTASISSEVEDLDEAGDEAKRITEKYSGYVIGYTKYDDSAYSQESITVSIRVPVENFEKLVEEFEGIGKVTYQTSNGDDVTDQYVDLESKLRNLEASEQQYMVIMKSAVKVSEILEVQRELTSIRSEIEVLKGQMEYYKKSADLSSVSITFGLKSRAQEVIDDTWDPSGTIRSALRSLTETFQFFADSVIYIVILSPVILVPALIIWGIVKIVKKVRLKAK